MSSPLWILNSSLVGIIFISAFLSHLLKVDLPPKLRRKPLVVQEETTRDTIVPVKFSIEKIYQNDIFGTFVPKEEKASKKSLVSPIPDFSAPSVTPAPDLPTYDFVAPLDISIKGIILADEEERCVAMIEDDTKKENLYHLGDKIKDAQVIKIAQNRVVFLRGANGQLETVFLRKDDTLTTQKPEDRWKAMIKKGEEENVYEIDPTQFKEEFDTLGNFLERSSIVGAVYKQGAPIGIKVGALDKGEVGEALGLEQGDMITAINGKKLGTVDERMKIYTSILEAKLDDTIAVSIKRGDAEQINKYKLAKIRKDKPSLFGAKGDESKKAEEGLARSRLQEREKLIREFKEKHQTSDQTEAVARIRQRLLENLRSRVKDTRVR